MKIKLPKQKVIVVISAYNEEKAIEDIIKRSTPFCDDIVVALAKKSSDNTRKIVESMGIKILVDHGLGKGDGMRCAINAIKDGILVFIDSDGSHIPEDIPKIVKPILEGKADMVIASRFLGGSEELHGDFSKFIRMFLSMCIAQIMNWRFNAKIMDTQNGFRAIKAEVAKKLKLTSKHTEIETEMCMKCFKKKYRVFEVGSLELKRKYGESNIHIWKHGWGYLWQVFSNLF